MVSTEENPIRSFKSCRIPRLGQLGQPPIFIFPSRRKQINARLLNSCDPKLAEDAFFSLIKQIFGFLT